MKEFLKKGQATKIKVAVLAVISIIAAFALTIVARRGFIWDRVPIFGVVFFFIGLHFIYKLKDLYEFIYKNRFYIAGICLIIVTLLEYSGSSIGIYNDIVQSDKREDYFTPIFGKYRSIRSDEWSVNTPIHIAQSTSNDNKFLYYNDNLRGETTDMSVVCSSPIWDLSILGKPFNIGYIILGVEKGLAFLWYGKLIALILVAFEFCMLLTKENKILSLAGMFAIVFSAATQWWYTTTVDIIMWGMLAIVLFDKFMLTDKIKIKILYSIGLFISGISYIFVFYPAWLLSYGYIFGALVLWVILKNIKQYKISIKDIVLILFTVIAIIAMVYRFFYMSKDAIHLMTSTDYPGERFEIGGHGGKAVFSYVYSFLFPHVEMNNPCELSGFISYFPIPMIVAVIYAIRNTKNSRENLKFIIPILVVTLLLSIWTFCTTNRLFAKLTLLYMVPPTRSSVPLGFAQLLLLIYLLGNLKKEDIIIKGETKKRILAVVFSIAIMYIAIKTDAEFIMNGIKTYVCGIITLFAIYQILNINKETNKKYMAALLIVMGLITGATVNPVQKGISVIREKPVSREIQKIVSENKKSNLWIADNTTFYIPNYVLANGAKVINSTNIYPNFKLYKTIFGEDSMKDEIRKIYNRYAHLNIEISNNNKLELLYQDSIKLYLTPEKVKELGVGYILSTRNNLNTYNRKNIKFERIYNESGIYIYEVNY